MTTEEEAAWQQRVEVGRLFDYSEDGTTQRIVRRLAELADAALIVPWGTYIQLSAKFDKSKDWIREVAIKNGYAVAPRPKRASS